jgi:hypothetical protein
MRLRERTGPCQVPHAVCLKGNWSASGLCFWGCLKGFRCLRVLAGFCCPHHFSSDDALVGLTDRRHRLEDQTFAMSPPVA